MPEIERGQRGISVDELAAIGRVLDVRPWDLAADCAHCGDQPPAGFTCRACGREG